MFIYNLSNTSNQFQCYYICCFTLYIYIYIYITSFLLLLVSNRYSPDCFEIQLPLSQSIKRYFDNSLMFIEVEKKTFNYSKASKLKMAIVMCHKDKIVWNVGFETKKTIKRNSLLKIGFRNLIPFNLNGQVILKKKHLGRKLSID